jgi:superfamily II DNA/RNA helicase
VRLHESEKTDVLLELLRTRGEGGGRLTQVLVFVNSKIECRRLARQLQKSGVNADAIHGDKTQDERMKALEGFKAGTIEVLVATDVAARGLDIVELPVVINYDVPFSPEDYVHRIGRTGRAGASGLTIMMMTGSDERSVAAIERLTKQKFETSVVTPPPRRERGRDERERAGRDEARRPRRESPRADERAPDRATPAPADDFFSRPYESGAPGAGTPPVAGEAPTTPRTPGRVAALLGGKRK